MGITNMEITFVDVFPRSLQSERSHLGSGGGKNGIIIVLAADVTIFKRLAERTEHARIKRMINSEAIQPLAAKLTWQARRETSPPDGGFRRTP